MHNIKGERKINTLLNQVLLICVGLLALPVASVATCYTVYDSSDKAVYKSTEPPFDLSIPISEGVRTKFPGGHLAMSNSSPCYLPKAKADMEVARKKVAVKAFAIEIPSAPKVENSSVSVGNISVSQRSDGALCPMYLASQPHSSGINDWQARELDNLETRLYIDARAGQISWVQLVDKFYARCAALIQGYLNENNRELAAYQRVLAEKMDAKNINESEWIFLQESKLSEIRARNQLIENTRPAPVIIQNPLSIHRSIDCTTREWVGGYRTSCD